jgi:uncharacterized membrane protein
MELIREWIGYLALGVEVCGAVVVAIGVLQTMIRVLLVPFHKNQEHEKEDLRLSFGRWLSLALEFLLAADILRTTIAPTWEEIGILGSIILLRTILNYFLDLEIAKAQQRGVVP